MASRILKTAASTSVRRHSSTQALKLSPFPELDSLLVELQASLYRKVASIRTVFVAPDNPEVHGSEFIGPGVCIDPALVVTSARVVGRVAAARESGPHKAYIGSTAGLSNSCKEPVKLEPVAVSFASDVAVLKVVGRTSAGDWLPVCPAAASPPEKESILMALSYDQEDRWGISAANVRASAGQKTVMAKAPWPLDDGLAWLEHDWLVFYSGPPPPSSVLFNCKEKVTGSLTKMSGSPWFNLYGELVGVASWVLRDDPVGFSVGYVAPLSNIRPVVDYAKNKGPKDPVVMDSWFKSEVVGGDQEAMIDPTLRLLRYEWDEEHNTVPENVMVNLLILLDLETLTQPLVSIRRIGKVDPQPEISRFMALVKAITNGALKRASSADVLLLH